MKQIQLTQGQVAIVDDKEFKELSQFKWYAKWEPHTKSYYARRNIRLASGKRTAEYMHRRILGLQYGDSRQCDHINHATLDNRRSNIRIATQSENQHNNRSKGFCWHKHAKKYMAQIRVSGVQKCLGYYDTTQGARTAYLEAKSVLHPSVTNTPRKQCWPL